ncbi:hypothetical protein HXX76_010616 [Chlamydomonas incerta]|uniref:Uncharacterized protein n=1 Tax=Chlamydomonas incerta TaxID=51695 RepID=A0A835SMP8_CHLIN|nr:hypothetical protein HXX76_010616 [Chlamydomonas incerta]|eukprot:KAG2429834.1 hypothetical protein HXX76_010616 [Chlamydomonas incerta]
MARLLPTPGAGRPSNALAFSEALAEGQHDLLPAVAAFRTVLSNAVNTATDWADAYQQVAGLAGLAACELLLGLAHSEPRDAALAASHAAAALTEALITSYSIAKMEAAKAAATAEQDALFDACGGGGGGGSSRRAPNTYAVAAGCASSSNSCDAMGILGLSVEELGCQECVLSVLAFALSALHGTVRSQPEACCRQAQDLLLQLRSLPGVAALAPPAGAGSSGAAAEREDWDASSGAGLGVWRPPGGMGPASFVVQLRRTATADGDAEHQQLLPPALESFARFLRQVADTLQRGLFPDSNNLVGGGGVVGSGGNPNGCMRSEVYLRASLEAAHHQVAEELESSRGVAAAPLLRSGGSGTAPSSGVGGGVLGALGGTWLRMGAMPEEGDGEEADSEEADWACGHDDHEEGGEGGGGGFVGAASAFSRYGAAAAAAAAVTAPSPAPGELTAAVDRLLRSRSVSGAASPALIATASGSAAAAVSAAVTATAPSSGRASGCCPDSPLAARAASVSGLGPRPSFAATGCAGATAAAAVGSSRALSRPLSLGPRAALASPFALSNSGCASPAFGTPTGPRSPAAAAAAAATAAGHSAGGGAVQALRSFTSMREPRLTGAGGGSGGSFTSQRSGLGGGGILAGSAAAAALASAGGSPCSSAAGSAVTSRANSFIGAAPNVAAMAAAAAAAAAVSRFGAETLAAAEQPGGGGAAGGGWGVSGLARRTTSLTIGVPGSGGSGPGATVLSPRHRYDVAAGFDGEYDEDEDEEEDAGGELAAVARRYRGRSRTSAGGATASSNQQVQWRQWQQSASGASHVATQEAAAAAAAAVGLGYPYPPVSPASSQACAGPRFYGRSEPGAALSGAAGGGGGVERGDCFDGDAAAAAVWTAGQLTEAYRSEGAAGADGGGAGALRRLPSTSTKSASGAAPSSPVTIVQCTGGGGGAAAAPGLTQTASFKKRSVSFAGVNGTPTISNSTPSDAGGAGGLYGTGGARGSSTGGGGGIQITRSSSIKILDRSSSGRSFSPSLSIGTCSAHAAPLAFHGRQEDEDEEPAGAWRGSSAAGGSSSGGAGADGGSSGVSFGADMGRAVAGTGGLMRTPSLHQRGLSSSGAPPALDSGGRSFLASNGGLLGTASRGSSSGAPTSTGGSSTSGRGLQVGGGGSSVVSRLAQSAYTAASTGTAVAGSAVPSSAGRPSTSGATAAGDKVQTGAAAFMAALGVTPAPLRA